jgi:hypothetical protein
MAADGRSDLSGISQPIGELPIWRVSAWNGGLRGSTHLVSSAPVAGFSRNTPALKTLQF